MKKILILFLSWLVPGSGYWILRQKAKGIVFFFLIVSIYYLGIQMLDFSLYFLQKHHFYFTLNFAVGIPSIVFSSFANNQIKLSSSPDLNQLGFLCVAVSSLLNILLLSKTYFILSKVSSRQ
ncbi:DUF6677 family protein [Candidatus Uabimicrobium sp. HlEnr_7]|uniref:DUF6677 family protein n=1 Tax=Candidatus Uabimicrobium helgolandensis TaxID=3095367 RepID=UPI0035578D03